MGNPLFIINICKIKNSYQVFFKPLEVARNVSVDH